MEEWSQIAISSSVDTATRILCYSSLKDKQKEAIVTFVSGKDVFVALPTGYGKSLCYMVFFLEPLIYSERQKGNP